jgi:hypothetical protein
MYYVVYKIKGFEGEKKAGPYTAEEVAYQKNEIFPVMKAYMILNLKRR